MLFVQFFHFVQIQHAALIEMFIPIVFARLDPTLQLRDVSLTRLNVGSKSSLGVSSGPTDERRSTRSLSDETTSIEDSIRRNAESTKSGRVRRVPFESTR